ncbi:unnamed protein product [Ostreobium quekettii]|uniref:PUA domain-containing protein n=1 Tax=Ostreobium quekettii TaxID=121088 RepID=A0A8S1J984_9CHLO|nr:unnamed protein product [Ostreobium quekettii]|eukprot:evm.model.scf_1502.1 EVM.evm.TU.scf_1502.1   scf_1502:3582-9095(-)
MPRIASGFLSSMSAGVVVIKVGTSSLVDVEGGVLRLSNLARICETAKELRGRGYDVVLVSSGAVGVGCQKIGLQERPAKMSQKQALAAVGQPHLMKYYHDFFSALGMTCAQVLLTNDSFVELAEYLNAKSTFKELLKYGAIPVVNENDTVATDHIKIGDNDTLSAKVAIMVEASWLFLMTDVECLYTSNPRVNPDAKPIHVVNDIRQLHVETGSGTQWGSGGMATKLTAARLFTAAGGRMAVCESTKPESIVQIMNGEQVGTVFNSIGAPLSSKRRERKKWILSVSVKGQIWMDDGALDAVYNSHASLFAAGITRVIGDFGAMDSVALCSSDGSQFGVGLSNYTHEEIRKVKGKRSKWFADELSGYMSEEMVHQNNICLLSNNGDSNGESDSSS